MSTPTVTAVIPTHGRAHYLQRAINSVLSQANVEYEIIVVDDNGRGTKEQLIVEELIESIKHPIQYVVNDINMGGCFSRNRGLQLASGAYIGFLDDDDEWLPKFLSTGLLTLEEQNADIVYCDCISVNEGAPHKERIEVNTKHSGHVWQQLISGWCPSSTSLILMKRAVAEEQTLFDPQLSSFQDYDCWLSLSQKKYTFCWHSEVFVRKHKHSGEQITTNTDRRRDAILVLREKWVPQLNTDEVLQFNGTLEQFRKNTYLTDFNLSVNRRQIVAAAKNALLFIRTGQASLTDLYRLLRSIL